MAVHFDAVVVVVMPLGGVVVVMPDYYLELALSSHVKMLAQALQLGYSAY